MNINKIPRTNFQSDLFIRESLTWCQKQSEPNTSENIANQNTQYVQGPKMDWTEDTGLHQWFKDWREEVELLLDTVLSHIRN